MALSPAVSVARLGRLCRTVLRRLAFGAAEPNTPIGVCSLPSFRSGSGGVVLIGGRQGADGRCGAGLHAELLKDMLQVLLDGAGADRQNRGDFDVVLAGSHQGQNLPLALRHRQMREMAGRYVDPVSFHEKESG